LSIDISYENKRERKKKGEHTKQRLGLSFLASTLHKKSQTLKKNHQFIGNLMPNNRPKMFKISPCWPQDLLALTPSLQWA
jgi:hypothetical protein